MRGTRSKSKNLVERQASSDKKYSNRSKGSFRNHPRRGHSLSNNKFSPDWEEAQTRVSKKLSDLYKNPQLYTGLWQNTNPSKWNFLRTCLLLVPSCVALQFCAVFPAFLSAPNLLLLGFPPITVTLQFSLSGVLGACFIFAFRNLIRRYFNHRGKLVYIFFAFSAFVFIGAILVLMANIKGMVITSVRNKAIESTLGENPNNSSTFVSGNESLSTGIYETKFVTASNENLSFSAVTTQPSDSLIPERVSLLIQLFAFFGYAFLTSSMGSAQYLLQSIAMTITHSERHQLVVTIATIASASGGCLAYALGVAAFRTPYSSHSRIFDDIVFLSSVNICLLALGAGCFGLAWHLDTRDLQHSASAVSISQPKARRPSRTAQEIFDECAHLLGHHTPTMPYTPYHSRPPKYYDPSQQRFVAKTTGSPTAAVDGGLERGTVTRGNSSMGFASRNFATCVLFHKQETLSTASERSEATLTLSHSTDVIGSSEILKRYSYAVPKVSKENNSGRPKGVNCLFSTPVEMWKMLLVLVFVFCLSSSAVSFEYTTTTFLFMVEEKRTAWHCSHIGAAIRKGSVGLLLAYLAYSLGLLLYSKFQDQISWRKLTLGACLVSSLLTLLLAILRDAPEIFFPAAFFHGLLKVMVLNLPHLLTLQTVRSQGGHVTQSRRQLLIETPTSVLWCLMPASLALTGAVAVPLVYASGRVGTPMMYSAVSGFMGSLGLIALL